MGKGEGEGTKLKKQEDGILKRIKLWMRAMDCELREHKCSFIVYVVLRLLVTAVLIFQILNHNYESVFLCLLTLLLLLIPSFFQVTFRIELPTMLEIIVLLFIFAAEILGEIQEFYIIFPYWDTILHTLNGFLAAGIGLSLVDLLNRNDRLLFHLSPTFAAIVSFCFSMTIGVVWEIFEFSMDQLFGFDMQKDTIVHQISSVTLNQAGSNTPVTIRNISEVVIDGDKLGVGGYLDIGLIDTMWDLIVNLIGALIFAVIGFFYVKYRKKNSIVNGLLLQRKKEEADFLRIEKEKEEAAAKDAKTTMKEEN